MGRRREWGGGGRRKEERGKKRARGVGMNKSRCGVWEEMGRKGEGEGVDWGRSE
jgi:hypothetical protein